MAGNLTLIVSWANICLAGIQTAGTIMKSPVSVRPVCCGTPTINRTQSVLQCRLSNSQTVLKDFLLAIYRPLDTLDSR
ncbi:hypothetical protein PAMP_023163 [Pampus punctatissimus]